MLAVLLPLRQRRRPGHGHCVAGSERRQRLGGRRLERDHAAQNALAIVAAAAHLDSHERRALCAGALHRRCDQGAFDQDGQYGELPEKGRRKGSREQSISVTLRGLGVLQATRGSGTRYCYHSSCHLVLSALRLFWAVLRASFPDYRTFFPSRF